MKRLLILSAVLAFCFCFAAGVLGLVEEFSQKDPDIFDISLSLYFIGKAIFVGAMLAFAAHKVSRGSSSTQRG